MTRRQAKWREANKVGRDLDRKKDTCTGRTGCQQPKAELHGCPYQHDVENSNDAYCTCCDVCTEGCADDV